MANFLFDSYRNSLIGVTATIAARIDADTDTLCALFNDDGTVTPLVTHVFQSTLTTAENPSFASKETLASVTCGVVAVGVVDFTDPVFDGSQQLTGSTSVESFIVFKSTGAAATSPLLARFDTATGLPLTPNTADVTVVVNGSGAWKI